MSLLGWILVGVAWTVVSFLFAWIMSGGEWRR